VNWLNISIQTLDSENFLGSDPIERGTWLCLLRYCIGQENGGTISGCIEWSDRKWQQLVRITKKESSRSCDLWSWDGDDLIVWGYPKEKETEVKEKRERAKTNGAKGGRPSKTDEGTNKEPTLVNCAKAERNEKGKEVELRERYIPREPVDLTKAIGYGQQIGVSKEMVEHWHSLRSRDGWTISGNNGIERPVTAQNWMHDLATVKTWRVPHASNNGQSVKTHRKEGEYPQPELELP
jgi:hypothetical protein